MGGNKSESMLDKDFKGAFYAEPSPFTYAASGVVFVNSVFSNTVYKFSSEDKTMHAAYCFDFEGRGANMPNRLNGVADFGAYMRELRETNSFAGVSNFNYFDGRLFFSVREGDNIFYCTYKTDDGVFRYSDKLFESLPNNYIRSGTTAENGA